MKSLVTWFAKNTVAANLLMLILVVGGLITLPTIKKEIFPSFGMDIIIVSVIYPGAAPEEVEESICLPIEEAIEDLEGIDKISSVAGESNGRVTVEIGTNADSRKVLEDIKTRVDAIDTFPDEAERPLVTELMNKNQVINIAVSGQTDEVTLKKLGQKIRDEITDLPGITQVTLVNARPYEITIELSEENMRQYGVTFDEISRSIRRSSLDLPGGIIKTKGGEVLLRIKKQAYVGSDFEDIVIRTRPDGTRLKLGNVAKVIDGFTEVDKLTLFNGQPAVNIQVFRVGDQSVLEVAETVKEYLHKAQARMPAGISLTSWQDNSLVFKSRLDLLKRNGIMGFILVFIILMLFLRFKLAFWVSIGIPISFLGAIWMMPSMDVSINMLSLFAFILVLGIVVDDAIIVGESIYTHQRQGKKGIQASIDGVREVSIPVIFAVLTTMAAFFPMMMLPGYMGVIWRIIPAVIIPCLFFSLVESQLVLPAHLSHFDPDKDKKSRNRFVKGWLAFQGTFSNGLELFIERFYRPALKWTLNKRYLTLSIALTALILTVGYVKSGRLKLIFFPAVEADFIVASLNMPQGTPVEVTAEAIRKIEQAALRLRAEFKVTVENGKEESVIKHVISSVGEQPMAAIRKRGAGARADLASDPHLGEIFVELQPAEKRDVSSETIAQRWRELTGPIPAAKDLNFTASLLDTGTPLNFQLSTYDLDELQEAAEELKDRLGEYAGVFDISDSYEGGKKEIKFMIKPSAEALGISMSNLARQIRQGFYGDEAQQIQRGRDDVKVMVRYPLATRQSEGDVENMMIRTLTGDEVPLSEVASVSYGRGYASIQRTDRKRTINITADLDKSKEDASTIKDEIVTSFLPKLTAKYPNLSYTVEGEQKEMMETMDALFSKFIMALFIIFVLMAIPFRSYVQPAIVMLAIPFGLIGAIIAHVVFGMDLSIMSMLGLVALTGVVVNDSLVLVTYINRKRESGQSLIDAVRNAGAVRFRPIILTSLTTFGGLTPLMLEKSMQAKFLVPMAVSLAFGVLFATSVTLFIVPSVYVILEDIKSALRRILMIGKSS